MELPSKAVFDEIVDVCYHASMLTEEGRPTVFRIGYVSSKSPVSPRDEDELPPVTRYPLKDPIPFIEAEIRRLAPVADPRRVLIAVEQVDGRLQIHGLIDIGAALWEMGRHERISGFSSPDALIIMSNRPGELSMSRGDRPVLRLRDGRIAAPAESVLLHGPVAEFFALASQMFIREACERSGIDRHPDEDEGLNFAHLFFIESVLLYAAELRHGGTLLFVPDDFTHEDSRLLDHVTIKYVMPSKRPHDAVLAAMAARLKRTDALEKLEGKRTIKGEEMESLSVMEAKQQECEDAARDAARFIASLTAVDGAVVLTDTLRVIGFGVEVTTSLSGMDKVYVAQDVEGTEQKETRFSAFGTRHRSAYRFAGSMENGVAFVMSQDGGVKAVKHVGSKLLMWPYFKIGFASALT